MRRLFSNLCFLRSLKSLLLFFSFMVFAQDMHLPSTQIKTVQPSGLSFSFTTSQPTSLALPSMTTSTRGNFSSPFEGQFIYNSTAHQPEFWNGSAWTPSAGSSVLTTLGDILYENATPANTRLPGNTTATKKYLSQTGTGSVSAAPSWLQPACGDLSNAAASCSTDTTNAANIGSGTLPAARLPNPSASTLGGVESALAVTHQWINSISTSGVPALSQPAFTDISGVCTIAQGCTNNGSLGVTAGSMFYADGSKIVSMGAGTAGQVPVSAGTTVGWGTPQGGLIGEREYITNTSIEVDASGWTAYSDVPTSIPVDCTGGSPSSTIARNTSSPITGTGDLLWTKSAANRQGEGFSTPLTIGTADTQIPGRMTIEFDYKVSSGTFAPASLTTDSDMEVFVYDVTNAALIQPFNYKLFSTSGHYNGSFQLSKNSSSYRLCVHTATTSASAYNFEADNLSLHPPINSGSPGPGVIVASRAHVSTGASTTSSNPINFDTIDYDYTGSITTGAGTWNYKAPYSGLYVVHGAGYYGATSNDLSAYVNNVSTGYSVFTAIASTAGGNGSIQLALTAGQTVQLRPTNTVTPAGGATTASVNFFEVFMVAGSSGSSIPNPVIAASAYLSANVSAGTTVPVKFDTKLYDYSNSYSTSTGQFTAPVAGLYQIGGFINPPSSINVNVYKNGIYYITVGWNTGNFFSVGTMDIPLNANETIDIRPSTTVTFGGSTPSATAGTPTSTITFKLLQSFAPGSGSSNVASSSYLNLNLEYVSFGGSTEPSTCASSPCTMYRHTPAITSITRSAGGTYSINFASGTFSQPPVCNNMQGSFSFSQFMQKNGAATATAFPFITLVNGVAADAWGDLICTGPR